MLWAIDVGNTQTVVGIHEGGQWLAHWRLESDHARTEDEIAGLLKPLFDLAALPFVSSGVIVASVVPPTERNWERFCAKYLQQPATFLRRGDQVDLRVTYDPPHAVGADRLANALAAWERFGTACIVVDFGTATTFDVIDHEGTYVGGAIMPGPHVALESLAGKTAKLPTFALETPARAIGTQTVGALQSGFMFGYAGGIDAVARRIKAELQGDVHVISTGGLGTLFLPISEMLEEHCPTLTLDGLLLAWDRLPHRDHLG